MNLLDWFRPYPELKHSLVNLKSGTVFRGVVYRQTGAYLVLRNAEILEDRGTPVKRQPSIMDGEVLVAQADVDFIQVTGAERLRG